MDPLSISASIIAILQMTNAIGSYLHNAKDASSDRGRFMLEVSNLSNLLITLLSRTDDSSDDPWHSTVRGLGGREGVLYQYRVALSQLKDNLSEGRGIKKMTKTLLWKHVKKDVEDVLSKMERLKSLVQIALEMDHFKLSQATHDRMTTMHSDTIDIKESVRAMQQDQDRQRHRLLLNWLSSIDFEAQQHDLFSRRQEDTGLWFIASFGYSQWINGPTKNLFCPGIPGAGKTMMTAIIVNDLQSNKETTQIGIVYLYRNYKSQAEQSTSNLLAAMLKQLIRDRPSTADPAWNLYNQHQANCTRPSSKELLNALQTLLATYSTVYVVIDALDECSDHDGTRSELLNACRSLQEKTELHLLITSRLVPDIESMCEHMFRMDIRASHSDVARYVMGQVSRLPKCIQRDEELQHLVRDKIMVAVDGMFLLARLYVDSLLDKRTKAKVIAKLDNFSEGPEALDAAYSEVITRIDSQLPGDRALAKSILSWIVCAQRPLSTTELCHALAVETEDKELDFDNILETEDIRSVCAGLVVIDEEVDVVRLVHYTAQKYLESILGDWNRDAQLNIASACLTYLCFKSFRSESCPTGDEFVRRLNQNPFFDYAARYWGHHVAPVQEEVSELAMDLLHDDNLVNSITEASCTGYYWRHGGYTQIFARHANALHLTAARGLLHLSKIVLSRMATDSPSIVDAKDNGGRTPLMFAAREGHEMVVRILLERKDVKADSKDWTGQTPLSFAAANGHEAVVRLLIERDDVESDSKNPNWQTPLLLAAKNGKEVVVKLLAERDDVETDWKDRAGRTPLSYAAQRGHLAVVKLLVSRSDVNGDSKDQSGNTPLIWAAEEGHEAVVELLIEHSADVHATGVESATALLWAARGHHTNTVKRLIAHGADVDAKSQSGGTALSYAAREAHEAMVMLLLENGADVDSRNKYGQTPLCIASIFGYGKVIRLLVDAGANVESQDCMGRTSPWQAAAYDHEAVVAFLARISANLDAKDEKGVTPPIEAVSNGHRKTVAVKLEHGANVDVKDSGGQTEWSWAVKNTDEEIVKLLESYQTT